ncbi:MULTISPECIES: hypothetical protein [unclassified Streptomyces]|uniref:hypothetical protein n=1 Tax=unclassified Streptomyces TaxID=2593676 RepID=UPI0035D5A1A3
MDEGMQCETCRPQAVQPARDDEAVPQDRPHYRIVVGGLECFTEAVRLLIRAGARGAGSPRHFAVDLPIGSGQAQALEDLRTFSLGSDSGSIKVTPVPEGAKVMVDPGLPDPDLSGLGDIDSWWLANGYPADPKWRG